MGNTAPGCVEPLTKAFRGATRSEVGVKSLSSPVEGNISVSTASGTIVASYSLLSTEKAIAKG